MAINRSALWLVPALAVPLLLRRSNSTNKSIIQSILDSIRVAAGLTIEVPEVARYVTVAETLGGLQIPNPQFPISDHHFYDINAPGLINGSIPILFFRTKHEGRPRFSIRLNSTRLIIHTFEDDSPQSWHIFIPPRALKIESNELVLNVASGEGSVIFSDVAILYRSNKLTVSKPSVFEM